MKRLILTGLLALAAGLPALMAQQQGQKQQGQQPPQGQQPAQGQQQAPQEQLVPGTKSAGESQAVMALFNAAQAGPDAIIKAADGLLTAYADTSFKEQALYLEAEAYRQKGDVDKAQIYGERVLEVNPNNFQTTLMIGGILAGRTRENDLDKEEKLTRATKLLNDTMTTLQAAAKPNPQLPDAQWEEIKKYMTAEAHNGLGLIALTRKKYDVAISEFKTANEMDAQPAYQVRLASAYQANGDNAEAIAIVDKLIADPATHPTIKQVAQNIKTAAEAKK